MDRPLHILIANSGRRWIGEVAHCAMLHRAMEALGHKVRLVGRRDSDLERHAREHGMNFLPLGFCSRFAPWGDLRDLSALIRLIRRERIDILHVHRGKDHWLGAAASKLTGVPLVRTRHVVVPMKRHAFNRWLLGHATDAVLSVSKAAEASFGGMEKLCPRRRVILSAVDAAKFNPSRRSSAWRAGSSVAPVDPAEGGPFWIGLIGRFQNVKGQAHFLEAARRVADKLPSARFLMAGQGTQRKVRRYEKFIEENGLKSRVVVAGILPDLPEAMASLDVGVVASVGSEGSSRVTLEYMASGTAVVATRVGGIPDALEPEGAPPLGLLVPPRDPEAMAAAILTLANDPARRAAFASAGVEAARRRHDPGEWARSIESIYRDILEKRRGSP